MSDPVRHRVVQGDTLTPLGAQLKQRDSDGVLQVVNLTGTTVKFAMVAKDGTSKLAATSTGVTVTAAATGKVQYDFQAADVNTAGLYFGYFIVTSGGETSTFPVGRSLLIEIMPRETA